MPLKETLQKTALMAAAAISLDAHAMAPEVKGLEKSQLIKQTPTNIDFFNHPTSSMDQWSYQVQTAHGIRHVPLSRIDTALLQKNGLDDIKNGWGQTLLTAAVMNGKTELVDLLLTAGANANKKNHLNQSPLYLAVIAAHGKPENATILKSLVQKGADVHETDADGRTLLMQAARYGDAHTIQVLLEGGAKASEKALQMYKNRVDFQTGNPLPADPRVIKMLTPQAELTQQMAVHALDKWLQNHSEYHIDGPMIACGEQNHQQTASLSALLSRKATEK